MLSLPFFYLFVVFPLLLSVVNALVVFLYVWVSIWAPCVGFCVFFFFAGNTVSCRRGKFMSPTPSVFVNIFLFSRDSLLECACKREVLFHMWPSSAMARLARSVQSLRRQRHIFHHGGKKRWFSSPAWMTSRQESTWGRKMTIKVNLIFDTTDLSEGLFPLIALFRAYYFMKPHLNLLDRANIPGGLFQLVALKYIYLALNSISSTLPKILSSFRST